jgi:prepilin peptidase CpaA
MPQVLKIVLIGFVFVAAVYDLRFRRIPNWLNLTGAVVGIGVNAYVFARHGILLAALGLLLPLAVYLPLYLLRAMGAGDVKLMAAVGSIVGPHNWLGILLCTAIAGGLLALAVSVAKGRLRQTIYNVAILAHELLHFRAPAHSHSELDVKNQRSMRLPHGVAIATGALAFLALQV